MVLTDGQEHLGLFLASMFSVTGQATGEPLMSLRLIFSGCSPPHPQHHSGCVPWTRAPSANLSGNTEESKCPAGGGWEPIFSKFRTVLGTLQGSGITTMDRPPSRQGESRAGGCRYRAAQAAVLLPLPVSTQTKGIEIGAHTYSS